MRHLLVFVSLFIFGCAERTEVVVGVATDLKAKGQIDLVTFTASRNGTPIISHDWPLADLPAGHYELPGSFGLYSPDGEETRVELSLKGMRGTDLVTQRDSILSLVSGKTLFMRMAIVGDCGSLSQPTCSAGQTCVEGVCRAIEVDGRRLPAFRKELVTSVACDSGSQFIISSTGDLMPMLAATCAADEFCQEGTCYKLLGNEDAALAQGLWVEQPSNSTFVLRALWGTPDGADVFAVGDHGTILHLTAGGPMAASSWVAETSGTTENLYAIYGTSASDVWAAGANGTFVHRDATGWTAPAPTVSARIEGLWATATPVPDVWAVGRSSPSSPLVLRNSAASWNTVNLPSVTDLRAIWGSASNDVWVVGEKANVLHWTGTSFAALQLPAEDDYLGVGGAGPEVYLVGRGGLIRHGMTLETSPVSTDLFHVWANPSGSDIFVVGDYGVILHRENGVWVQQPSHTTQPLFAVWGSAKGELFAAGRGGVLLHNTGLATECASDADCVPICQSAMFTPRSCVLGACVPGTAGPCAGGLTCFDTTSCRSSCDTDNHCQDTSFCAANGECVPTKARGRYCDDASECKEGGCRLCGQTFHCTDSVCCDKSASQCGGCMHCTAPAGTCDPEPWGTANTACETAAGGCLMPVCNGRGGCENSGDACGTASCDFGTTPSSYNNSTCHNGTCTAEAIVSPCPSPLCSGDFNNCDSGAGPQTKYCDGNKVCRGFKQLGESCDPMNVKHCAQPPCNECGTGHSCVDGVCCDTACRGQCQACDLPGKIGTCSTVASGDPHGNPGPSPRPACGAATSPACALACNGSSPSSCSAPSGECAPAACDSANNYTLLSASSCSQGACPARAASSCAPYACAHGACRATCTSNGDCASTSAGCDLATGACK